MRFCFFIVFHHAFLWFLFFVVRVHFQTFCSEAEPVEDSESGSILPLDSKLSGQEVKIVSASCDGEPENGDHGRIEWSKVWETDELADPKRLVETYC